MMANKLWNFNRCTQYWDRNEALPFGMQNMVLHYFPDALFMQWITIMDGFRYQEIQI